MTLNRTKLLGLATIAALVGGVCGYAAEAQAIDRIPFQGRPYGDAGPGYGAERQYYGAEKVYRPYRGHLVRRAGDRYRDDRRTHRDYGSFVDFRDGGFPVASAPFAYSPPLAFAPSRAGVYPGFGGSSIVYFGNPGDDAAPSVTSQGPKIIDVARSRLDRQDEPKSGVSITYVGTAKIIRIASGTDAARPSRAEVPETRRAPLEPWSEGWERYCTRTHPDFDPTRGTFTDDNGRSRFCTGE